MDLPIDFLRDLDIPTLLAMGAMLWLFTLRIDKKFDGMDKKFEGVDKKFAQADDKLLGLENRMNVRFDKLDDKVTDVDRRLCRLEGAFASKDCCMVKDDRVHRKVD